VSTQPKNILILSLSGIGNFLMQSPVFEQIKTKYPNCRLTVWVAPRGTKQLADINPYIDAVIEHPIKASPVSHFKHSLQLSKEKFDFGIALSPGQLWKGAAYLFLAGIPKRIGHKYPYLFIKESSFFLTDTITENDNLHDLEQNLRLLKFLGIKNNESKNNQYIIHIPPSYDKKAQSLLSQLKVPDNKILIGIHAGSASNFLWKRWPISNFAKVCKTLIQNNNAHILIFGGANEKKLKEDLKSQISDNYTIISTDLITTAAIIERSKLFISNDSGLMHLAASTGTPTFGLFGPTDEKHTAPRGPKSFIVRAPNTKPVYNTEKNHDLGQKPHTSILSITPEQVLDNIKNNSVL
jgi:heptosyltransferase-2